MANSEKIPLPEDIQKPQTAMELAFANARRKENPPATVPEIIDDVDVKDESASQYGYQLGDMQEDMNILAGSESTSSSGDNLVQVETKPGLAWVEPKEDAPLGRERPPMPPVEEGPFIQVETKKIPEIPEIPVGEATELNLPVLNDVVSEGESRPKEGEAKKEDQGDALEKYRAAIEKALKDGNVEEALKYEQAAIKIKNLPGYVPPKSESTPKENREGFLAVMAQVKEKFGMSERAEKLKTFLRGRLNELHAEEQKIGSLEKGFRFLGEQYNKAGWKTKLAVGLTLGIGSGAALGAASMPAAIACLSGIAVQRVAALSSAFMKYERSMQGEKWGREKAMGKAMRNAALMTGAMLLLVEGVKEGFDYAKEHEWGDATQEWLKAHWPFGEANLPVHHEVHGVVTEELSKMPTVGASHHGYEGTLIDAFAKIHEPGFHAPANLDPHSDLGRLLAADNHSIGKVAQEIAIKNGFYHADGTSGVIHPHDSLTFDTKGNALFTHGDETVAHAPNMPHATLSEGQNPHIDDETRKRALEFVTTQHPHEAVTTDASALSETSLPVPAPVETVPVPIEHSVPVPETGHLADGSGAPVLDSQGNSIHTGAAEVASSINRFGIPVPSSDPHLYLDVNKNIVSYGGSLEEKSRLITEYLSQPQHKGEVIYASDDQSRSVPWFQDLVGKIQQGPPTRTKTFFGFGTFRFDPPPHPNDFEKIIR